MNDATSFQDTHDKAIAMCRIDSISLPSCPLCGGNLTGFKWEDMETVVDENSPAYCDAAMMWGNCPNCRRELYLLEVGVVPDIHTERFVMDNCWHEASIEYYVLQSDRLLMPWRMYRHIDAENVTFFDKNDEPIEHCVPKIDVHTFSFWCARTRVDAYVKAQKLTGLLLRIIEN